MSGKSSLLLGCIATMVGINAGVCQLYAQEFITPSVGTPLSPEGITIDTTVHHYEYVFPQGWMYVYDMDNAGALIKQVSLPTSGGTRGETVSPKDGMVYISYGGDGGQYGNGSLLQYNIIRDSLGWVKDYPHGVDSHAMSVDGTTIYMPSGELTGDGKWYVVNTSDGSETGTIVTPGQGPHNTIVSLDGSHVYLGNRNIYNTGHDSLYVANTATNQITKRIGGFSGGIRPFTINGTETFAFVTVSYLLGFQVCNLTTGQIPYTVDLTTMGFPLTNCGSCASVSHGISLSPDEKEVYVIDFPNSYVHVFDVSGLPQGIPPTKIADIKLPHLVAGIDSACAYDCQKLGRIHHSLDGRFVFVGETGDVINTSTRTVVATLPALRNTVEMLEIDWQHGRPIATSTRTGVGQVTINSMSAVVYSEQWNIVSVPRTVSDYRKTMLFPTANSGAFAYLGNYASQETLRNRIGYWVKFPASETLAFNGHPRYSDTIDVVAGWNLVGSISIPVPVISLTSVPPGLITNGFFGYGKTGYVRSDTIVPCRGYWVKVVQGGKLIFSSGQSAGSLAGRINIVPTLESPPAPPPMAGGTIQQSVPERFALDQNYPNPFNPTTRFDYALPSDVYVSLKVYNVLGQVVAALVDEVQSAGFKSIEFDATSLPSGMFFYRLTAGTFSDTRKMMLVK